MDLRLISCVLAMGQSVLQRAPLNIKSRGGELFWNWIAIYMYFQVTDSRRSSSKKKHVISCATVK
jgi:hypothetical protein